MTHRNSPLSVEGGRRLVERCRSRPISHVAAEMGSPVMYTYRSNAAHAAELARAPVD